MGKEVERLSQLVCDWLEISELQADAGDLYNTKSLI